MTEASGEPPIVRIEFDTESGAPSPLPPIDRGRRSLPLMVLGGILTLGLVGLLVLAALPDDDNDADESVVAAPVGPTQDSATTPTTSTTTSVQEIVEGGPQLEPVRLAIGINSFAVAERGWLALSWDSVGGRVPRLSRSLDGTNWSEVETSMADEVPHDGWAEFSNLVATPDGFALLMATQKTSAESLDVGVTTIRRLVSEFGVEWSVDPAAPMATSSTSYLGVAAHDADSFSVAPFQPSGENSLLALLFKDHVQGLDIPDPCWVERLSVPTTVYGCSGESVELEAKHLINPDTDSEFLACVRATQELGSGVTSFLVGRVGDEDVMTIDGLIQPMTPPTRFADGTLVVVDEGSRSPADGRCEGFLDLDDPVGAALLRWDPGADVATRVPLPDLARSQSGYYAGDVWTDGRLLWVPRDGGLVTIDIDTGASTEVLPAEGAALFGSSVVPIDGNTAVLQLGSGSVTRVDLETGVETELLADGRLDHVFALYADENVVFLETNQGLRLIRLDDE